MYRNHLFAFSVVHGVVLILQLFRNSRWHFHEFKKVPRFCTGNKKNNGGQDGNHGMCRKKYKTVEREIVTQLVSSDISAESSITT